MKKPITRKRISAVWFKLQSIAFNSALPAKNRSDARDAMDILDEIRADMRRKEILAAGAKAERERCAKIAEAYRADEPETIRQINYRNDIAALIRGQET